MCGIAGLTQSDPATLWRLADALRHRGPDDRGIWQEREGGVGFAHTRLAIIDLSPGGHQPMVSDCGRYAVAYNGEIYNYQELRNELIAKGERFRSASDTEVLLALLRREGLRALDRLAGMFAIAFFDRERRELLLCRDRLGKKPLVHATVPGGHLAFSSEIAALQLVPGIDRSIDPDALSEYFACLYIPAPRTIYRGIRKLPPGGWLRWHDGRIESGLWWKPDVSGQRRPSVEEAVEELLPELRRAVSQRMIADVPVGCFLSGGTDSSVIAALMAEESRQAGGPPVRTFTMSFAEAAYDESAAASVVAQRIGTSHTVLPSSPRLVETLDDMVTAFGEPFGNPTALLVHDLSRKAREHVTVALVGDGGDEVFAGYPRYSGGLLAARLRRLPGIVRNTLLPLLGTLVPESAEGRHTLRRLREFLLAAPLDAADAYAAWVEYFSPEERGRLLRLVAADLPQRPIAALYETVPSTEPLDAMQQTDLQSFLPGNILAYADAMSMQHALELRAPLIDHRLIEAVSRVSPGTRFAQGPKTLLKAMARRLLPADIVDRPKRGFNPPMGLWLKRELSGLVAERLTPMRLARFGLDATFVKRLVAEHGHGRDHGLKIWSILVLDAWADAGSNTERTAQPAAATC